MRAGWDEPPARSLGELRDELRRHLERIAAEEDDEDGYTPPDRDAGEGVPAAMTGGA